MKYIIIILLGLILLGCKPQIPSATTPSYTDYKTGTQGIEIEFIQGQPPEEIWEEIQPLNKPLKEFTRHQRDGMKRTN